MRRFLVPIILLCTYAVSMIANAQSSPESDEAKFIRLTHQIEQDPLGDTDKSIRSWLLQWAMDSEDITVIACDTLETLSNKDAPNNGIYTTQMMFGNAAYQIAHPDKRDDLLATQLAGVRSSLKAYTSIIANHPEARIPHFDDLISKDKAGKLEAYLAPIVADKCSESGGA